ncbi:hypothetical protein [Paenibacillus sp. VMFN-D1]|uniref:hypothetical protein n=1 Tax=Paenibacillus sp. VMFN-D1 TaxID=2135608 RepID=UPI000E22E120|nr:hypothetical protein [Paenibacillus sp. VMFN-D1]RED34660.1 hypothetical protein C7820_4323 [Paenibacillus sp. VMFN-D1]
MAGKDIKLSLWALDPSINIESVSELMTLNYNKPIDYLSDRPGISSFDRTLMNRWREYKPDQGFEVQEIEVFDTTFRYIPAKAYFETTVGLNQAIVNGTVLPREYRISDNELPVFFFEYIGRVYVIVSGSEYKVSSIRKLLMGHGRHATEEQKQWQKVHLKDIPNYNFTSDFFYWLISKENQIVETSLVKMEISDIRFLAQTGTERSDVRHESQGANILDEAVSKTGLGVNSRVDKIGTTISFEGGHINLIIFDNGACWVDNYSSAMNGVAGELEAFEENLETGTLTLFCGILPELRTAYNTEKDDDKWTTGHQAAARKLWALGAINELCSENEITLDEISQLEWFFNKR